VNGLYSAKAWFTRRLSRAVDFAVARQISPDVFTAIGVLFAMVGAVGLWRCWPVVVLIGVVGRLAGANLDGAVARARNVARPFGFVLNEVGDRSSDFILWAGLFAFAGSRYGYTSRSAVWVLIAAIAATIPTFVSLSAVGAGAPRLNGGPFGKTERCLLFFVVSVVLAFNVNGPNTLAVASILVIVGSLTTGLVRLQRTRRVLAAQKAPDAVEST